MVEGGRFELPNPKERIYSPPRLATSLPLHYLVVLLKMAVPTGFEPALSCVTGRHVNRYTTGPYNIIIWRRRRDSNPRAV